jgi:hypothetical protein
VIVLTETNRGKFRWTQTKGLAAVQIPTFPTSLLAFSGLTLPVVGGCGGGESNAAVLHDDGWLAIHCNALMTSPPMKAALCLVASSKSLAVVCLCLHAVWVSALCTSESERLLLAARPNCRSDYWSVVSSLFIGVGGAEGGTHRQMSLDWYR